MLIALLILRSPNFCKADTKYYPDGPNLLFPTNNSTLQVQELNSALQLTWEAVVGADEYLVNINVNNIPQLPQITTEISLTITLQLDEKALPAKIDWAVLSRKDGVNARTPSIGQFYVQLMDNSPTSTPVPTYTPTPTPVLLSAPVLLVPEDGRDLSPFDVLGGLAFQWKEVTGAASYNLTVYDENDPITHNVSNTSYPLSLIVPLPSIRKVYQWTVQAIAEDNTPGKQSERYDFSVGDGLLPTPTPVPVTADLNSDNQKDAMDLFLYSLTYGTNSPDTDFNHTGINDKGDILLFIKNYMAK